MNIRRREEEGLKIYIFEVTVVEKSLSVMKTTNLHNHEAQQTPSRIKIEIHIQTYHSKNDGGESTIKS